MPVWCLLNLILLEFGVIFFGVGKRGSMNGSNICQASCVSQCRSSLLGMFPASLLRFDSDFGHEMLFATCQVRNQVKLRQLQFQLIKAMPKLSAKDALHCCQFVACLPMKVPLSSTERKKLLVHRPCVFVTIAVIGGITMDTGRRDSFQLRLVSCPMCSDPTMRNMWNIPS